MVIWKLALQKNARYNRPMSLSAHKNDFLIQKKIYLEVTSEDHNIFLIVLIISTFSISHLSLSRIVGITIILAQTDCINLQS